MVYIFKNQEKRVYSKRWHIMKKSVLLRLIELKRIELHMTAKKFGLLSKETIRCSEELDHLLNTFQNK